MIWDEALAKLADHPHARRFRALCESEDPETRESYRGLVVRRATGDPVAPMAVRVDYGDPPPPVRPCCG